MEPDGGSKDAVRRLESIVAELLLRVEHLEEELRTRRPESFSELNSAIPPEEPISATVAAEAEAGREVEDSPQVWSVAPTPADLILTRPSVPPPVPTGPLAGQVAAKLAEALHEPVPPVRDGSAGVSAEGPPSIHFSPAPALPSKAPERSRADIEAHIATYWFPRIGLALFALMFVYVAQLYSRGPWPKIAFGYTAALALTATGLWQRRKQPVWAEPVIAGGLALSYFMTYSMGFIRPMKVIDSVFLEVALLSVNVLLVLAAAQWLRSEVVAGVALVLGYFTTGISGTERYALVSVGLLSVAAVVFMAVNRWVASTVVSVVATYAAHLYAYMFLDRPGAETPAEVFWHHASHLIAYFAVFALGALIAQRRVAENSSAEEQPASPSPDRTSGTRLLAMVVQINLGFFVSGMIYLLRQTGVYWDDAWMFFFPLTAVAYGFSRLHAGLQGARAAYQLAAAAGLAFGLMSTASPAWLPVLLGVQALGLLRLGARERSPIWTALSLAVLVDAGLETLFPGKVRLLGIGLTSQVPMEWWTVMATSALFLAYIRVLERAALRDVMPWTAGVGHLISVLTALMYALGMVRHLTREEDAMMALLWAGPTVAAAAIALRTPVWLSFTTALTIVGLLTITVQGLFQPRVSLLPLAVYAAAATGAGVALEKIGTGSSRADGNSARFLYFGVHAAVAVIISKRVRREWFVPAETAVALVTVTLAFLTASRRFFWSALVPSGLAIIAFCSVWTRTSATAPSPAPLLLAGLLMVLLAGLYGTYSLAKRLGDPPGERRQSMTECALMLAAGFMVTCWGFLTFGPGFFLTGAVFGAAVCAGAVLMGRPLLTGAGFFFLCASVLLLARRVAEPGVVAGDAAVAWAGIGTVALIVAAERVLACRERFYGRWGRQNAPDEILSEDMERLLGKWLTAVGMATLLLAIYSHPAVRSFYLSAAIVGAGFAWIVLGFLFKSGMYRKIGFGVVCLAVVKALGYDTRRLSRELQIVSLGILGGVLLIAGWLYGRYRSRLPGSENSAS